MSKNNRPNSTNAVDPVMPDQGGRMTNSDPVNASVTSHEVLEVRAYHIYESRGRTDGHALDDWLAAEAERNHCLAAAIVGHSESN